MKQIATAFSLGLFVLSSFAIAAEGVPAQVQRFIELGLVQGVEVEDATATVTVNPIFHDAEFSSKADVAAAIFQSYADSGVERLLLLTAGTGEAFAEYSETGLLIY